MPTYIKAGYWEKLRTHYKGWLNLDDLINSLIPPSSITTDELEALQAANSPSATNPLATIDDVGVAQVNGLTLLSTGWTLVGALYEYDLAHTSITASTLIDIIPINADIQIVIDAQILSRTTSSAGSVKIYSMNEPTANIGVSITITKLL